MFHFFFQGNIWDTKKNVHTKICTKSKHDKFHSHRAIARCREDYSHGHRRQIVVLRRSIGRGGTATVVSKETEDPSNRTTNRATRKNRNGPAAKPGGSTPNVFVQGPDRSRTNHTIAPSHGACGDAFMDMTSFLLK